MKAMKMFLATMFLLLIGFYGFAQDQIIKKNLEIINCKIREVASDEIKYLLPDYPQDVIFSIEKEKVGKIVFENGQEMTFQKEMTNPENYLDQKKNALKIDFMSPLTGNTTFSYERSLKPGRSIEASLGIIGLGIDPNDVDQGGSFIKFGMKFIKSPDFYLQGLRYAHILKGSYFKPEIGFSLYSKDIQTDVYDPYSGYYYTSEDRASIFAGFIQVVLGKQWVVDDVFLIDMYGGIGYGFDDYDGDSGGYHYGFVVTSDDVPFSMSAGFKIGFLFK